MKISFTSIRRLLIKLILPVSIIQSIKYSLYYCEHMQIYDKFYKFGDWYYNLNNFIKKYNYENI